MHIIPPFKLLTIKIEKSVQLLDKILFVQQFYFPLTSQKKLPKAGYEATLIMLISRYFNAASTSETRRPPAVAKNVANHIYF
jgi:hypothetical protein